MRIVIKCLDFKPEDAKLLTTFLAEHYGMPREDVHVEVFFADEQEQVIEAAFEGFGDRLKYVKRVEKDETPWLRDFVD